MPYIDHNRRLDLTWYEDPVSPKTTGELNFLITRLLDDYIREHGRSYSVISSAIAAATDAAEECRRRVLNPLEDEKIAANGDVYGPDALGRSSSLP